MSDQTAKTKDDHPEPGDVLSELRKKLLGPSWRTTLAGVIGAVCVAAPIISHAIERGAGPQDIPGVIFAIVLAVGGRVAKDGAVSGSTKAPR